MEVIFMAFNMALWKVNGDKLDTMPKTKLDSEDRLEKWIYEDPSVMGMYIFIIGRQVQTDYGGRIDLLGIDSQGDLIIIELKRDKTPRDVVAQVLDYASWVKDLTYDEVNAITSSNHSKSLSVAFSEYFGMTIPETINASHRMIIVASELDSSSERIVQYLAEEHNVDINAVFFNTFKLETEEFIGRAWLMDPGELQIRSERKQSWSGFWFVNVGEIEGDHRNWDDCRKYGYVSAGQGERFPRAMKNLKIGEKVFAYLSEYGYVGFGEVVKEAQMIKDFFVEDEKKYLLNLELKAKNAGENKDNPEMSEWAVGIKWIRTFNREDAKTFKGIFVYPATLCKLRNQETINFLKREFGVKEQES